MIIFLLQAIARFFRKCFHPLQAILLLCPFILYAASNISFSNSILRIPLQRTPASIDPAAFEDTDGIWIAAQLFQRLFIYSPQGNIVPELVRTWSATPGGQQYHFTLHADARFSDGSPVTSRDVAFTIRRLAKQSSRERHFLNTLQRITIHDAVSFSLRFSRPAMHLIDLFTNPSFFVLPKQYAAAIADGSFFRHPVSSGPFQVKSWTPTRLSLIRNRYYAGPPAWASQVHFEMLGGKTSLTKETLLQYDLIPGIPAEAIVSIPGFHTIQHLHMTSAFVTFNMQHHRWKERPIRDAFRQLLNVDALYDILFQGRHKSWQRSPSLLPYRANEMAKSNPAPTPADWKIARTTLQHHLSDPTHRVVSFVTYDHLPLARLQQAVDAATAAIGLPFVARQISLAELKHTPTQHGVVVTQLTMDTADPFEILIYFSADAPSPYVQHTALTDELHAIRQQANRSRRLLEYQRLAERLVDASLVIPIATAHDEQILIRNGLRYSFARSIGPWFSGLQHVERTEPERDGL